MLGVGFVQARTKSNPIQYSGYRHRLDAVSSPSHWPSNMLLLELAKEVSSSFALTIWVSAFIGVNKQIH